MKTFVVAKMLVVNDAGEMLALRRSQSAPRRAGELDFPGGWVEDGEDIMAAATRETFEEAGLKIDQAKLVFGLTDLTDFGSGTWAVFLARVKGRPEVRLSFEHDAFEWLKPSELLEKLTYERQRNMVRHVVDHDLLED